MRSAILSAGSGKMMPLWNPQFEAMARTHLRTLQLQRLKTVVERAASQSPFYRQRFAEAGVRPENIRGLEDIARLPPTTKDDLHHHYPWGL